MHDKLKYLQKIFGPIKKHGGNEISVRCPFCSKPGSTKKKLAIRTDTDYFHCWVCDIKGRNLSFLIKKVNSGLLSDYINKFGNSKYSIEKEVVVTKTELPEGFRLVMESLWDPDAKAIKKYCEERGITEDLMWRYRLGYTNKDFKLRNRVIIPSFDVDGDINYWAARTIQKDNNYKYLNAQIKKTNIVFNEIDVDWSKPLFVVEGPLDLVKCKHLNATCILGSSLKENDMLFYNIVKNNTHVILCLDIDAEKKKNKIAKNLVEYNVNVSHVTVENGDIGDLNPDQVLDVYKKSTPWSEKSALLQRIKML